MLVLGQFLNTYMLCQGFPGTTSGGRFLPSAWRLASIFLFPIFKCNLQPYGMQLRLNSSMHIAFYWHTCKQCISCLSSLSHTIHLPPKTTKLIAMTTQLYCTVQKNIYYTAFIQAQLGVHKCTYTCTRTYTHTYHYTYTIWAWTHIHTQYKFTPSLQQCSFIEPI